MQLIDKRTKVTDTLHSLLDVICYKPLEIGVACLENDLVPEYIQALSLTCNSDIMVTFDLTCDLLSKNP